MKKTFEELREVDEIVARLYEKNKEIENTKFGYAYKKFLAKNYKPIFEEFREKLFDVRVEHALVDEKTKEVLADSGSIRGFKYDKAGLKAVVEAERKIEKDFKKKEITIIPFISLYVPKEIYEEDRELLEGLIIENKT